MKKIVLTLLVSLTILICLTGCDKKLDIGEESTVKAESKEITLKVEESSITKKGATFYLENNRKVNITYTPNYEIEVKKDNKWYKINVVIDFVDEIYDVDKNYREIMPIDWSESYGSLPKGEYRVVKEITVPSTLELFYVTGEFTIK